MIPCQSHMLERNWGTLECSEDCDDDESDGDGGEFYDVDVTLMQALKAARSM